MYTISSLTPAVLKLCVRTLFCNYASNHIFVLL